MARFKPARGKKSVTAQRANAIGCITLIVIGFVIMFVMVYYTVRQG